MKRMFNDFLIREWTCILHVIKAQVIYHLHFVYIVKAIITLNWKAHFIYMSPFSSMPLMCIHLFFSTTFVYKISQKCQALTNLISS